MTSRNRTEQEQERRINRKRGTARCRTLFPRDQRVTDHGRVVLITHRSLVQIQPPQPGKAPGKSEPSGGFVFLLTIAPSGAHPASQGLAGVDRGDHVLVLARQVLHCRLRWSPSQRQQFGPSGGTRGRADRSQRCPHRGMKTSRRMGTPSAVTLTRLAFIRSHPVAASETSPPPPPPPTSRSPADPRRV